MRVALSGRSLFAVVTALALAFVAAMVVTSTAAQAQNEEPEKHAWCHATGSAKNPFTLVVVQEGGPKDVAHEGHADDVDLGETTAQNPAQFRAMQPGGVFDEDVECVAEGTTTTTTTGTSSTTTTGTSTTTTGTSTTGTSTTGTSTTGTSTTGTSTTGTSTTGTSSTTTGAASAQYSASVLPDTGGSSSLPVAIGAALLLVGGGLTFLAIRRGMVG